MDTKRQSDRASQGLSEGPAGGCCDLQFEQPEQPTEAHQQAIVAIDALRKRLAVAEAKISDLSLRLSGEKANHNCTVADAQAAVDKLEATIARWKAASWCSTPEELEACAHLLAQE